MDFVTFVHSSCSTHNGCSVTIFENGGGRNWRLCNNSLHNTAYSIQVIHREADWGNMQGCTLGKFMTKERGPHVWWLICAISRCRDVALSTTRHRVNAMTRMTPIDFGVQRSRLQDLDNWNWFPDSSFFSFSLILMKLSTQTLHKSRMTPFDFGVQMS